MIRKSLYDGKVRITNMESRRCKRNTWPLIQRERPGFVVVTQKDGVAGLALTGDRQRMRRNAVCA
jgi:hypothetical protein